MTVQTMPQLPLPSYVVNSTKGHTEPRVWTKPLRELNPETSYGYAVIEFAEHVLKQPLTPWQAWVVIHLGELLEDGRPRFRRALILVARQNGKTHMLKVLVAFWMAIQRVENILGLSTNRESARLPWAQTLRMMQDSPLLASLIAEVKRGNNDTYFSTVDNSTYRIRAANDGAARGLTIDRAVIDEVRQQKTTDAWDAVYYTIRARSHAQVVCISNAGDDQSVVLNKLHEEALEGIASGGDSRLGLFEWSAAPGDDITAPETWAKANPNMGYIFSEEEIRGDAISAVTQGGLALAGFKTEALCMRVSAMDAAVDPDKWAECFDDSVSLAGVPKSELHYFFDVSLTQSHATLVAAGLLEGKPHMEIVGSWTDTAMRNVVPDLKRLITKHGIKHVGYFPVGPAASFATRLKAFGIKGCNLQEVTSEVAESCMGLADEVSSKTISHRFDEIATAQIIATAKKWTADRWKFSRQNAGNCDAAYAAAGALLLARSEPAKPDFQIYAIKPKERS